jgi:hypothetical protein
VRSNDGNTSKDFVSFEFGPMVHMKNPEFVEKQAHETARHICRACLGGLYRLYKDKFCK